MEVPRLGAHAPDSGDGAYGTGENPKLYGSVDASEASDWIELQPAIWATKKIKPEIGEAFKSADPKWSRHQENGVAAEFAQVGNGFVLKVGQGGTASNHLQIWGPSVKAPLPGGLRVAYRARCTKPFAMPQLTIRKSASPWNPWFSPGNQSKLTGDWQTFETFLSRHDSDVPPEGEIGRYHLALGNLPSGCVFEFELLAAHAATIDLAKLLFCDVEIIVFDHGNFKKYHRCGIKRWSLDDCKNPGDYWYDAITRRVFLRWPNNPADDCKSIELALRAPVVDEGGCHDVVFENLCESTEVCLRMENDWRSGLVLDGNRWFQSEQPLIRWLAGQSFRKHEWKRIQDELGFEKNGLISPLTDAESKLIQGGE